MNNYKRISFNFFLLSLLLALSIHLQGQTISISTPSCLPNFIVPRLDDILVSKIKITHSNNEIKYKELHIFYYYPTDSIYWDINVHSIVWNAAGKKINDTIFLLKNYQLRCYFQFFGSFCRPNDGKTINIPLDTLIAHDNATDCIVFIGDSVYRNIFPGKISLFDDFVNASRGNHFEVTMGTIDKCKNRKSGTCLLMYHYKSGNTTYKNNKGRRISTKQFPSFKGKQFPVIIYWAISSFENEMLFTPRDFKLWDLPCPDSLKCAVPFLYY